MLNDSECEKKSGRAQRDFGYRALEKFDSNFVLPVQTIIEKDCVSCPGDSQEKEKIVNNTALWDIFLVRRSV